MKHVLVVRLDNDGDVLLTGPAIRAIARAVDRVSLLCGPRGAAAAELLPGVDQVVRYRAPWIDPDPETLDRVTLFQLVEDLGELALEEAIVFTSFHQSALPTALVLRLAGVRRIAAISEDYPGSLLDVRHRVDDDIHEVERSLSLAAAAGYHLPIEDDGRLAILSPPQPPVELPHDYVVVHPGASVSARAWSPSNHRLLVAELGRRGLTTVVTGGPSEASLTKFVSSGDKSIDMGGGTDLAQLASVIQGARAIVVGNTGPAHLAAAVGTPTVSIFAPTVPARRWHPWRVPHTLLGIQDIDCHGCRARVCPFEGHPCIDHLSATEVADAVESLVAARSSRSATSSIEVSA
jgi:ADP-heptose:LPS heptosyltransferase